jgi:hypothetical protein
MIQGMEPIARWPLTHPEGMLVTAVLVMGLLALGFGSASGRGNSPSRWNA